MTISRVLQIVGVRPVPDALAARAAGLDRLITLALLLATALLGVGLFAPILLTRTFYFFADEVSLVQMVYGLWREDELFLCIVVAACSIVFPSTKLVVTSYLWRSASPASRHFPRIMAVIDFLGRWSLADVLVVALVIVVVKSSGFAQATIGVGLYPFTASIVLTAVLVARIRRLARVETAIAGAPGGRS